MKIGQDLRSSDWVGLHQRFGEDPSLAVEQDHEEPEHAPHYRIWTDKDGVSWRSSPVSNLDFARPPKVWPWSLLETQTIKDCEALALGVPRENRASVFRKALYETADYQAFFGDTKIGSRAKNWKEGKVHSGEFMCSSLKEAFTVYQKLGKQDWYEKRKKGSSGGAVRKEVSENVRCIGVTQKGDRCSKREKSGECLCTQHFNILHR